jgi:hypothetical protein
MSVAEPPVRGAARRRAPVRGAGRGGRDGRLPFALAVLALLAGALTLRLWGIEHGLPFAYNADENAHFLPRAIGMFGHSWDPGYHVNPPAYTYLLHVLLQVRYGFSRQAVGDAYATDPTALWVLARATAAALGTLAVGLLVLAGAKLAGRAVGLVAGLLLAVAFLPVFYSHLALNDVPALAPLGLALWGVAGVLRDGRARWYALAGVGLGLACATKYTAGIALLPLLAAAVGRPGALRGLALSGALALACFVAADPYVVLDPESFWDGIAHQSTASGEAAGKLGLTQENGWLHYVWSAGWGLGWAPLGAAALAAALLWRADRRLLWVLAPAPVLFVAFMGAQERFFGRWLMPILPLLCLLAAVAAVRVAALVAARRPRLAPVLLAALALGLAAQSLVHSAHSARLLARDDTRTQARAWLVRNVPEGAKIVVEPGVVPDAWAQDPGRPSLEVGNGNRWRKFPTSRSLIDPDTGRRVPEPGVVVNIEDFERVLRPELVGEFQRQGFCWVVVGSTQRGRAEAEPREVPGAVAYYERLERESRLAFRASPYDPGEGPVPFDFDMSFTFYPLAYERPGPLVEVFRLRGGRCGGGAGEQ